MVFAQKCWCGELTCTIPCNKCMKAFEGLNKSYEDMYKKLDKNAPICHFTKMNLDHADDGDKTIEFWICKHCGHTKEL